MRRIELKVITRAKRQGIEKISENSYRIKVSMAPEKGKANQEVIKLFTREFKKPAKIVMGFTSKKKVIEI